MLHYLSDGREYWFCRHCWTEMPSFENQVKLKTQKTPQLISLSTNPIESKQLKLLSVG